jgi:hypothetical protein
MRCRLRRIASWRNSHAGVGRKLGRPVRPCSLTCSPTRRIIADRFCCWRTRWATGCCTQLPAYGIGRSFGNKLGLRRARIEWKPLDRIPVPTQKSSRDAGATKTDEHGYVLTALLASRRNVCNTGQFRAATCALMKKLTRLGAELWYVH